MEGSSTCSRVSPRPMLGDEDDSEDDEVIIPYVTTRKMWAAYNKA